MTEWRTVERPSMLSVEPRAQVEGDIPDVHVITVRERRVTVDYPTIIQHNVNTDTIELDLDGEWDGMSVVLVLGPCGGATELAWHGEPLTLPSALAEDTGGIDVSVVGYSADGETRLVTVAAPSLLNVIKSGCTVGEAPGDETPDLIGQLVAAGDAANKAAQAANTAAGAANDAAGAANTAASAANTAAGKANTAATKATDAATKATDAAGEATRAAQSANAAAEAASAAAEAARGNVLKGTIGPAPVLSADDAYATKPRRLTVYGNTRQNLWSNPSGTNNGVTVTSNGDGSMTLSGTATSAASVSSADSYIIRPSTAYTLSMNAALTGASFVVTEYDADGSQLAQHNASSTSAASFTSSASVARCVMSLSVQSGQAVSGTYRVMLNEGSTAQPWCPPGLNGVEELSVVTAGKNLLPPVSEWSASGNYIRYTENPFPTGTQLVGRYGGNPSGLSGNVRMEFREDYASDAYSAQITPWSATSTAGRGMTVTARDRYICIITAENAAAYFDQMQVQLELGSTATAYEPPNITTTPIDLQGHTLNALPDGTSDELTIDATGAVTLVQRVGETEIPSEASGLSWDVGGSRAYFALPSAAPSGVVDQSGIILCDVVPPRSYSNDGTYIIVSGGSSYVKLGGVASAADVADKVGGGTLLYSLATPQTIPLTAVTLPTLPSPNITVYNDSDVPSDITLEYERDVTIAFGKLAKQIAGTASAVAVREASTIEEE